MSKTPYGAQQQQTRMFCTAVVSTVFGFVGIGFIIAGLISCGIHIDADTPRGLILGLCETVIGLAMLAAAGFMLAKYGPHDNM